MCNHCSKDANVLLDTINKAVKRPNGRALRRKERALEKKIRPEFKKHADLIIEKAESLFDSQGKNMVRVQRKTLEDDVDAILDALEIDDLIRVIIDASGDAMDFGAQYRIDESRLAQFGISFDIEHPLAVEYLETDRPLELANMEDTTKNHIKPILLEALENGDSYQETSRRIRDNYAFSNNRATMIASNEIGHAYEWGNYVPMKDLQDDGETVEKKWSTTGDDRVTDECNAYEDKEWIPIDQDFDSGSTTDNIAPRTTNPRCRCTTLYRYGQ
jgi:hypothetical protein